MASTTLSFTGFSREDLAAVQQQFEQANADGAWRLVPDADADVLVIDMDSMYGHMTWLKAHGGGQTTVGVTAGERSETDFLLRRPVDAAALRSLLAQLAAGAPATDAPATDAAAAPAPIPAPIPAPAAAPAPDAAAPATVAAPATATALDAAAPATGAAPATAPAARPAPAPVEPAPREPATPTAATPAATPAAAPVAPEAAATASRAADEYIAAYTTGQMAAMPSNLQPHVPGLPDFLAQGALPGPARLQRPGAPALAFDPASRTWAGSATLKPLLPLLEGAVAADEFVPIDAAEFERLKAAAGGAHPYLRLLWIAGLAAGRGHLLTGYTAAKKFVLTKWPQIEREYPKHFRIATVMMKGPALLREIAEQAGVPEGDVADFVNAGLVSGVIVPEGTPAAAGDVERAVALLARPRPA